MEELALEILKNPILLVMLVLAVPTIMALSSNRNAKAWSKLTQELVSGQNDLQKRQTDADLRQADAMIDISNATKEMAEQSRSLKELIALSRQDMINMRDTLERQNVEVLDAVSTVMGHSKDNFEAIVEALGALRDGQNTIIGLVEALQDRHETDHDGTLVLIDGLNKYMTRLETLIQTVSGRLDVINARAMSE